MSRRQLPFDEEDAEILVEALEVFQRKHRDVVRPREERKSEYDPVIARQWHRAGALIASIRNSR